MQSDLKSIKPQIKPNFGDMTRLRRVLTLASVPVVVVGGMFAIKQSFFTDRHAQVSSKKNFRKSVLRLSILFRVDDAA